MNLEFLSAVMMTHIFHAVMCHSEQKPMLKLYGRSNLGGGALSSVLQHQWKESSKTKNIMHFVGVGKVISILSSGATCL